MQFIPGGQAFAAALTAVSAGWGAVAKFTADPPRPPAQAEDVMFGADQPMPYALGRCLVRGHLVHSEAHGRDREDVPNPWRTDTIALTNAGPVVSIDQLLANMEPVSFDTDGWADGDYGKYLRGDTVTGNAPSSDVLDWTALDSGAPPSFNQWSASHRLSGIAAMQFGMLLDAEETHFRSGPPEFAAVGRWTRHYDPRQDSTYPGGLGSQRRDDESTWGYSVNGVIQALTYFLGRRQNGKAVLGAGLPWSSIDVPSFVSAANVADANGWTCHGVVFENGEDGEIGNNAALMLETASAWFTNDGGILRCLQRRPLVTLDTIRSDDLVGPWSIQGMREWREGINTVVPTIVSELNEWAKVPIDAVEVPELVAAQSEVRSRSKTYTLVTDPTQAAQLAVLDIYDTVELDPIQLTVGRRFIPFNVGDAFMTDLPDQGLVGQVVVVVKKTINLADGTVTLGLKTDTTDKHAFALGQTSTAPPQPTLATGADYDLATREMLVGPLRSSAISLSYASGFSSSITLTEEADGTWTAAVPAHTRIYGNPLTFPSVAVDATSATGLAASTRYALCYDDPWMEGGAVTIFPVANPVDAVVSQTHPHRHRIATVTTPTPGGTPDTGQPARPPGTDPGDDWDGAGQIP
ncbi:hypothetical protein ACFFUB_02360 [Algimonas porphyrae]|uniref:hypothetical protein n=1 Tax=Algimonas porphyrae TaxID=1128113 RepID=UPI0024E0EADB|nr:hypothetical protein [Algimonas porphyrae]